MDRDDIFRLLLVILLLTNNSDRDEDNGLLWNINQIIIVVLLLSFNERPRCSTNDSRRERNENASDAEFRDTVNPF